MKASLLSRFMGGCPSFVLTAYRYAPLLDMRFSTTSLLCSYSSYSGSHVQSALTCMLCRMCPSASVHTFCFPCSECSPISLFSSGCVMCHHVHVSCATMCSVMRSSELVNQSINIFNVLGGNWDPTDKKFSSVNSYEQDLVPTCKAFPKETTTCIWFTQSHKVCNSTTVLQEVQML